MKEYTLLKQELPYLGHTKESRIDSNKFLCTNGQHMDTLFTSYYDVPWLHASLSFNSQSKLAKKKLKISQKKKINRLA